MLDRLKDVKFWGAVALLLSTALFAWGDANVVEVIGQFVAGVAALLLGIKMPQGPKSPALPPGE